MAEVTHKLTLSVDEQNYDAGNFKVRQNDENTQLLDVQITENGIPKKFEGLTPFFCVFPKGMTGNGVSEDKVNTFDSSKGTLKHVMGVNSMIYTGRTEAYFSFRKELKNGEWVEQFSTRSFFYHVEKSIYNVPIKESNYFFTFTELYRKFNQYIEDGKTSWEDFVEQNREIIESVDSGGTVLARQGVFDNFRKWDYSLIEKMANEFSERGINVRWFGAKGDGITDDTQSFKNALDFIRMQLKEQVNVTNILIVPDGEYLVTDTLVLPPYMKIESTGNVNFIYNGTDETRPCLHIKWHGDDPDQFFRRDENFAGFEWQRGAILSGGITFIRHNMNALNLTAVEIAARNNDDRYSGWKNIARSSIEEVTVSRFDIGIQMNPLDLYLFDFTKCHIEDNRINVRIGGGQFKGSPMNCGENIIFNSCILSNAHEVAIDQVFGGFDCTFQNCGIDFNELILRTAEYANNSNIFSGGNLEGNNQVVDSSRGLSSSWRATVIMSKNHLLMHKNAEHAPVFKGYMNLVVDNIYQIAIPNSATKPLQGQGLSYMCDEQVRISFNSPFYLGRPANFLGFLWSERLNRFRYGKSMKDIKEVTFWRNTFKLLIGSDVDTEFTNLGLTSSYKFISGVATYDSLNFGKAIKVPSNELNLRIYSLVKIKAAAIRTVKFEVSSFDYDNVLIEKTTVSPSFIDGAVNTVTTIKARAGLPATTDNIKVNLVVDSFQTNESFELGYVYVDFS